MPWSDRSLKDFGAQIQRLISKEELSREESYAMFRQILLNEQPDLQQGAFLAALVSKGETHLEIAGAWQAIVELDTIKVMEPIEPPVIENSGTGMDQLKTFNVSTAASVVAAAGGARLARHGARGLTSACGTVDLLDAIGIDVDCEVATVVESIKREGIGLFNGTSPKVHPQSLGRILSQIRFGSTLNIAASLASPCRPTHALRGVYAGDMVPIVGKVMKEIGYERAMIVHGFDSEREKGMDELSSIGETLVHEFFPDGKETTFTIAPEDVGIRRAKYQAVAALGDARKEAVRFMKIISATGHPECIDMTCLNAGAIFYVVGKAGSIRQGVEMSREIIENGEALSKLTRWVSVQADPSKQGIQRLLGTAAEAGIGAKVAALV
ncbi:MAG: anthranilate phosphoribosyltransferase [Desulfobacteraceae bacterium]|nr:anthranilate phosphoribosyltransferase [Desulfobacteraceae bacterium]